VKIWKCENMKIWKYENTIREKFMGPVPTGFKQGEQE
jgi:hypothetical protein